MSYSQSFNNLNNYNNDMVASSFQQEQHQQQDMHPASWTTASCPQQQQHLQDVHPSVVASTQQSKRKFGFLQKYRVELPEAIKNAANARGLIPLDENYKPSPYDIVCGRGRGNYNCEGNILFRNIVTQYVDQYLASSAKAAKTLVLVAVLEQVKNESNGKCRFVKQRPQDGMWCELGDIAAREKVGHAMREAIATRKKCNTNKRRAVAPVVVSNQQHVSSSMPPITHSSDTTTPKLVLPKNQGSMNDSVTKNNDDNDAEQSAELFSRLSLTSAAKDDVLAKLAAAAVSESFQPAEPVPSFADLEEDVKSDQVFGKPIAALPQRDDPRYQDNSVLSAVGSSDFLPMASSEFLKKYGV